jgi:hypothetical protein
MGFAIQNMHRGKKIGVPKTIGTENLDSNLPSLRSGGARRAKGKRKLNINYSRLRNAV